METSAAHDGGKMNMEITSNINHKFTTDLVSHTIYHIKTNDTTCKAIMVSTTIIRRKIHATSSGRRIALLMIYSLITNMIYLLRSLPIGLLRPCTNILQQVLDLRQHQDLRRVASSSTAAPGRSPMALLKLDFLKQHLLLRFCFLQPPLEIHACIILLRLLRLGEHYALKPLGFLTSLVGFQLEHFGFCLFKPYDALKLFHLP